MQGRKQHGSALIFGLVFLLILTVIGTAGLQMARHQLAMAGNEQFHVQALNAAEAAIEKQLAEGDFKTTYTTPSNPVTADTPANVSGQSTIRYLNEGEAPDGGFSSGIVTYRFVAEGVGQAPADADVRAEVRARQNFYVLAPGS